MTFRSPLPFEAAATLPITGSPMPGGWRRNAATAVRLNRAPSHKFNTAIIVVRQRAISEPGGMVPPGQQEDNIQ